MEINITAFFYQGQAHLYSASCAELGDNAASITWGNAMAYADKYPLLVTEDELEAFKIFAKGTGGWTLNEINSLTRQELNALFIQFVAGDMREADLDVPFPDWEIYEALAAEGSVPGSIFKAEDNQVYFYIGN